MDDSKDLLIKTLTEALAAQQEKNASLQATITELNGTVANLNETVAYLKNKLFGHSREKTPDPDQLTLDFFNEAEKEADPSLPEPKIEETVSFSVKKGNRKGREAILKDLQVKEVI